MKRKILSLAALGLAIASVVFLARNAGLGGPSTSAQAIAPASDLLKPANAEEIRNAIKALNSQLVLVNFWASWCEPCKKEFPSILSVREKLKGKGLSVLFISIDEPADFKAAEEFLHANKVDFQTLYKGYARMDLINEIYPKWEGAVPASILLDSNLQIVDSWEGDATQDEFEKRINAQLKTKAAGI